jgi:hypothetical protein
LYGANQAFALQTNDQLMTAEGFNNYILANRSGTFATTAQGSNDLLTSSTTVNPNPGVVGVSGPVRVRDVGRAIVAPQDVNLAGWVNTEPAIIIAVQRQSAPMSSPLSMPSRRRCRSSKPHCRHRSKFISCRTVRRRSAPASPMFNIRCY